MTSEEPIPDRCGAECRDGGYCTQYPVDGTERCRMHGGTQPTGMDSPNAVHGLRSDYLSEEDREIYDEVRQHDNVELLQEELWHIKTKLLRAARATEGNEGVGMAEELLEKVEHGQADEEVVRAFAKLIQVSGSSVDRAVGRLIDLSKQIHKQTEGDTLNVEHSGDGGGPIQIDVTNTIVSTDEHE